MYWEVVLVAAALEKAFVLEQKTLKKQLRLLTKKQEFNFLRQPSTIEAKLYLWFESTLS